MSTFANEKAKKRKNKAKELYVNHTTFSFYTA